MDLTQQGIIALLKSAILESSQPLPEGFSLAEAMPLIRAHHMVPLVFDGAARCGISRQTPEMQSLFKSYCKALQHSEGQMRQVERICEAFQQHGIDHMPLKGCLMKRLYPKPELRTMGDADILIRMEQYDTIASVMSSLGFTPKGETDHELVWEHPQLHLELHKHLIPSYNHDFYAYFGDGWQLAKRREGSRWGMTPEDEFLFLFTHFAKHYRDGGIGCRYMVDLWVYLRHNPTLDQAALRAELAKLELLEFWDNIRRLIAAWFEDGPMDEKLEFISQYIFASGSWGEGLSRVLSRTVRDSGRNVLGFNGRLVYLWNTFFMSADVLKGKYTILQKAPWLLPVVWVIRLFYKLIFEWKTLRRQKETLETLSQDNVTQRRQALKYVGLEDHF